jgi:hypothetical protein
MMAKLIVPKTRKPNTFPAKATTVIEDAACTGLIVADRLALRYPPGGLTDQSIYNHVPAR